MAGENIRVNAEMTTSLAHQTISSVVEADLEDGTLLRYGGRASLGASEAWRTARVQTYVSSYSLECYKIQCLV